MMDKYADRRAAYDILTLVYEQRRPLDEATGMAETFNALDSLRDRAFALLIVRTVLKRQGEVKACLRALLTKAPQGKLGRSILRVLAIGIVQILHLDVKPHAAVDGCVRLVGAIGAGGMKGLVNAVLRRMVEQRATVLNTLDPLQINTPEWLLKSWVDTYGSDVAAQIAEANLLEPPLDITLRNGMEGWPERLDAIELPTGSLRRRFGGVVTAMAGFQDGHWWVQDAAASMPAKLLGDINGKSVIDLCAAPGGKTAQLASMGATVTAVDRSKSRLNMLIQNLTRLKMGATVVKADASQWRPAEAADHVLLDAPCSATGTIRRHPDILRLKNQEDITALGRVQAAILDNAAHLVKPEGRLVYCTCSIEAAEGPDIVEAFLKTHPEFEREPVTAAELGNVAEIISPAGDLRTLPCHMMDKGGLDGFYAARLRRKRGSA